MKYKKVLRYNQLSFLPCINTVIDQDLADKSFKISILIQIENMLKRSVTLDILAGNVILRIRLPSEDTGAVRWLTNARFVICQWFSTVSMIFNMPVLHVN